MNIFRFIGDMTHLASTIILLHKIFVKKSSAGFSLKSVELYGLVYGTRYVDLHLTFFMSLYNSAMKVTFLGSTAAVAWLMRYSEGYRQDRDDEDGPPSRRLLTLPCLVLALLCTSSFTLLQILWTFSVLLEAVALVPQLILTNRLGEVDSVTEYYTFLLGQYRIWYLLNWCYRSWVNLHRIETILWVCGIVQSLIFMYFFLARQLRESDPRPDALFDSVQVELEAPLLPVDAQSTSKT